MRIRWTYVLSLVIMGKKGEKGGHSGKKGTCCFFSVLGVPRVEGRAVSPAHFALCILHFALALAPPPAFTLSSLCVHLRHLRSPLPFAVTLSSLCALRVLCVENTREFRRHAWTAGLRREA